MKRFFDRGPQLLRRAGQLPLSLVIGATVLAVAARAGQGAVETAAEPALVRIERRCSELLESLRERGGFPGASAALVLPDGAEVAVVVGEADREAERPMDASVRLLSGSIGKTYVTAAAHHLVQTKRLALDDRAAGFFEGDGWFAEVPNAGTVTVRQLLRHESGIPRYVFEPGFWEIVLGEPDKVWKPEELLAFVTDEEPLFAPGEGWAYADTNYLIVGMIVERVSGEHYYDYVREHFLGPHGLDDTIPSNARRIAGLAQGYVVAARQLGVPERVLEDGVFVFNPQFEWCGGGYANTPLDLARWARILYSGAAFEGPYLETLLETVAAPALGPGMSYGLGVMVSETDEGPLRGHDGFMPGYLSSMGFFSDRGISAAIQLNTDDGRALGMGPRDLLVRLTSIAREELDG